MVLYLSQPSVHGTELLSISQGSVATLVRLGGNFGVHYVADLLPSLWVKESENRSKSGEDMIKEFSTMFFDSACSIISGKKKA